MNHREVGNERDETPSPHSYAGRADKSIAGSEGGTVAEIRRRGPLSFADFMALALYDPARGYYARPDRAIGRRGDFYTSVSAGPVFGDLLARHFAHWADALGRPARIVELGAHDGTLAADLLGALDRHLPAGEIEYAIIEPLDALARRQRETLAAFDNRVRIVADAADLDPRPTLVFGNEVLDALPFRVVESAADGWRERGVGPGADGGLAWHDLGPAGDLAADLPPRPPGYRTEVRPDLEAFLRPLVRLLDPGRMLWIDYGFERDDYYHESRTEGTLRTYAAHRAGDDPLDSPGEHDLTAHVEFTALREALEALGGTVARFESQGRFLTELARPWLLEMDGRSDPAAASLLRNFQTLTHPGHLGGRFQVMEAVWE
jgi:SAM-dependent MidA family methyltransferase